MGIKRPSPFVAALLALVSPGLGHLYVGHKGWFFFALAAFPIYVMAFFMALAYLPGLFGLATLGILALGWLIGWPTHARRLALQARASSSPNRSTRPWVLVLAVLLTIAWVELPRSLIPYRTIVATSWNMQPTIDEGDHFVVVPVPKAGVGREDIVLYAADDMPGTPIIGRVVAMGGDLVEMRQGVLYLNGSAESASYVHRSRTNNSFENTQWGPLRVPAGTVFILGDHRNMSLDSRDRGPISLDRISGVAARIHYSKRPYRFAPDWDRIGTSLR